MVAAVKDPLPLEQLAAKLLDANGTVAIAADQQILPDDFDTAAAASGSSLTSAQWQAIVTAKPKTGSTLASLSTQLKAALPALRR